MRSFNRFNKKYLPVTKILYQDLWELRTNPPLADAYIAGSDQIWNVNTTNGLDPAFYLDFAPKGTKRISYAASFATMSVPIDYQDFLSRMIHKIDNISVRESQGISILKEMGINRGYHVLDPVFLLSKEHWLNLAKNSDKNKYILVYDFENNPTIQNFVQDYAKENKLNIFSVNNYSSNSYADKDFHNVGPELFLRLIRNASCIVSNSFHATAFSIIFEKEFFVFFREVDEINSRIENLLDICHLSERIIRGKSTNRKYNSITYASVKTELEKMIQTSQQFLHNALSS